MTELGTAQCVRAAMTYEAIESIGPTTADSALQGKFSSCTVLHQRSEVDVGRGLCFHGIPAWQSGGIIYGK